MLDAAHLLAFDAAPPLDYHFAHDELFGIYARRAHALLIFSLRAGLRTMLLFTAYGPRHRNSLPPSRHG